MTNPGEFNRKITFQKKEITEGPFANLTEYADYKTVWAKVWQLNDRQVYAARAANIKTDIEFTIRYREDIDISMRIAYDNKFYEIDGIRPVDSKRDYLIITAHVFQYDN